MEKTLRERKQHFSAIALGGPLKTYKIPPPLLKNANKKNYFVFVNGELTSPFLFL
jgi:hypothetical protein